MTRPTSRPGMSQQEVEQLIDRQWRKHQPRLYHELRASESLDELIRETAELTLNKAALLERQGLNPLEAWSVAVRENILLSEPS